MAGIDSMRNRLKTCFGISSFDFLSHTSLYFRLLIITFLVFAITILLLSYQMEKLVETTHIEVVKDELKSIAAIAAYHIDGFAVERLQKPEQEESDLYKSVRVSLLHVMQENKKIHDIYIMRQGAKENELLFVVDAAEAEEEHAALGELYDADIAPNMLKGFIEPSVDEDFTIDRWGQTLSGYAPVYNAQHEVVGGHGL
jgi:hypothetical protein